MAATAITSEVGICNLALTQLKQPIITSIDDPEEGNRGEELCNLWYQHERQATLRSHPWNFAIRRIQITPNAIDPLFGFTHAYDLPSTWLRYLSRHDSLGSRLDAAEEGTYQIEGRQLLMNGQDNVSVNFRYIFDEDDVVKFDQLFVRAFSMNLAIRLAPNFSSSEQRLSVLAQLQLEIMAEARAIDGQERPPIRTERSIWRRRRRFSPRVAGKFTIFK